MKDISPMVLSTSLCICQDRLFESVCKAALARVSEARPFNDSQNCEYEKRKRAEYGKKILPTLSAKFYKPQPMRSLEEIRADILAVERETEGLLDEIIGKESP